MLAPMSDSIQIGAALVGAYLVGSIPFALLIARHNGIADIRTVGDRNPGFWNAYLQIGLKRSIPILIADTAKGSAGVAMMVAADPRWPMWYLAAGAAMVGHAWPLFAGGRGGRSVLTFVGAILVLAPFAAACAMGIAAITWPVTRRFAVAARVGMFALPFAQLVTDGPERTAATGALMTFVGFRFLLAWRAEHIPVRANAVANEGRC